MSRRSYHRILGAAVLLILCAVGFYSYLSTQRLIENSRSVAHSHQVMESLEALLSTMRDAESGQRAYLLTGDAGHLRDSRSLQENADSRLEEVAALTADNAEQRRLLSALRPMISARFVSLREGMDVWKGQGMEAAIARVRNGQGRELMEALEWTVLEMKANERRLLKSRSEAAEASARMTLWVIGFGSFVAVLLGVLTAALIQHGITQRERAEARAQESRTQLQAIMDHSSALIWLKDLEGKFVFVNQPYRHIFGVVPGKTVYDYFPRDMSDAYTAADRKTVEAAGPSEFEEQVPQEDGLHTYLSNKFPLRDSIGTIYALCCVSTDITERKRVEQGVVEARDAAERVSRFKDQFLSTMSHELRTPLNAILGFSELLADDRHGLLNDRQRRYVANVHTGGQHLLRLINDILDLSKIEAGRLELAMRDLSLLAVFQHVQEVLDPMAAKKQLRLSARADPELLVHADPLRLQQILMNLAGNAIKFTPAGGSVELGSKLDGDQIEISVCDTGPGIPPEEQKRIFEAFYRLKQSGQHTEGTGLGLAIAQRLVELHGDTLRVESTAGEGSRFCFRLSKGSYLVQERRSHARLLGGTAGRARVMVVEDDPVSAHLIQTQLESAGYAVTQCKEPKQAVETAARLQPAAITLDMLMRPMSGAEVLAALKSDSRTRHIPVVVVTVVDEPAAGSLLGAHEYLVKPVDKLELLAAIRRCLKSKEAPASLGPILVVEDDDAIRETIVEVLRAEGYLVITNPSGVEARESVQSSLPAAVVLDLLLPGVSGIDLLKQWRADPRTENLPVIILTSKDLSPEEGKYLKDHASFVFLKHQPWQQLLVRQLDLVLGVTESVQT